MRSIIKTVSVLIILLGIVHVSFAFPLYPNTDTLWFTGAGMAIIFAGLLNFAAIDRGGSRFTYSIAVIVNGVNTAMFCFALVILNEPQVYAGIVLSLAATIAFIAELLKKRPTPPHRNS